MLGFVDYIKEIEKHSTKIELKDFTLLETLSLL
jgi:hypothetical protein